MNQKEILKAIREEIRRIDKKSLIPECDRELLKLHLSEIGFDELDSAELCTNLERRFGAQNLFEHCLSPFVDIKIQDVFDFIVYQTFSDEGTAMDSAAADYCHNIGECAIFKRGWEAAMKWYKENQI